MEIDRNVYKMQLLIRIDREEVQRAFTSQNEYNAFIARLSKLIYEYEHKRGRI